MNTAVESHSIDALNLREPIPGYRLHERIGSGGYGEVWRATAPGGLQKAIKIVFGPMSDSRADRELKSLERIRLVSHPLLLSVERFEIVDGHLIIVTELAECSLKDRFDQCIEEGGYGIPRDELLTQLRDAADALDFLYDKHQLQHLDVKPENMLLLSGHIKVADFGLIKDLSDKSMSLVGGLTPMYAPPEVFDGRPNQHSDQYSLAIVYQEMLTGEPPFAGRTAAQLASQHIHSEPVLSALPHHDRAIIARALSKDHGRRYPNCQTLVRELTAAPQGRAGQRARRSAAAPRTPVASRGVRRGQRSPSPKRATTNGKTLQLDGLNTHLASALPASDEVTALPTLEISANEPRRPTLFVGIGNTAMRVLKHLRRRLRDRLGPSSQTSMIQIRLLDVDLDTLGEASRGKDGTGLSPRETLHLPLRQTHEYRDRSELLLEWLNRRWLYNIPRSLKTEGIRPLGRLAFVDHYQTILNALSNGIEAAMEPEGIAAASSQLNSPVAADAPRVVVVSSISGGVGSGAVLDMGYAVRHALSERGYADDHVCGVMIHSTSRRGGTRDLSLANSLCCLNEFAHYSCAEGGYPGEPACGLPPRGDRTPPFAHSYLAMLGDELDDETFDQKCDEVASYLLLNSVSAASAFFDRARPRESAYAAVGFDDIGIRSFGTSRAGGVDTAIAQEHIDALGRGLLLRWAGADNQTTAAPDPAKKTLAEAAERMATRYGLSKSKLLPRCEEMVHREFSDDSTTYFRRFVRETRQKAERDEAAREIADRVLAAIDEVALGDAENTLHRTSLRGVVVRRVLALADQPAEKLDQWLVDGVDAPTVRLGGARKAALAVKEHLEGLIRELVRSQKETDTRAVALTEEILKPPARGAEQAAHNRSPEWDEETRFVEYAMLRLTDVAHHATRRLLNSVLARVGQRLDAFDQCARRMRAMADAFTSEDRKAVAETQTRSAVLTVEMQQQREMSAALDKELEVSLFQNHAMSGLLAGSTDRWAQLMWSIRSSAERVVHASLAQSTTDKWFKGSDQASSPMSAQLEEAAPQLMRLGAAKRLLVVAPAGRGIDESWMVKFRETAGQDPTVLADDGDPALTICYETEKTPLHNVIAALVGGRADFVTLSQRLHTRIDIDWPPLVC